MLNVSRDPLPYMQATILKLLHPYNYTELLTRDYYKNGVYEHNLCIHMYIIWHKILAEKLIWQIGGYVRELPN